MPILIVEDEALLAMDLAEVVEQSGGHPVGPVPTTSEALSLLATETVRAAILDANLLDRDVTPVALALLARSIPFVVHTAVGLPRELAADHPHLRVVFKPVASETVVAALTEQIAARVPQAD